MSRRNPGIAHDILDFLVTVAELLPRPFETPYAHVRRIRKIPYKDYDSSIRWLHKRGNITIEKRGTKRLIKATEKGQLQILFNKAAVIPQKKWDKKWRVVVFDIPEDYRAVRHQLRRLLKRSNFIKLQASVFISPYPLNSEAITYLKKSGLIEFIRILRVDRLDDDNNLRKHYKL